MIGRRIGVSLVVATIVAACGTSDKEAGPANGAHAGGHAGQTAATSSTSSAGGGSATGASGSGGASSTTTGSGGAGEGGTSLDAGSAGGAKDDAETPIPDASAPEVSIPRDSGVRNDGGAFIHPGVLDTSFELSFMKEQVSAGREPWKTAFDKLKASSSGSLNYMPAPRAEVACGSGGQPDNGCSDETRDSEAVYAQALLWAASGDVRYAQKCANILNAWSAVLTTHGMSNAPLQIGWTG